MILNGTDEGTGPKAFPRTERVTGIKAITNNKYGNERTTVTKKLSNQYSHG